ncbi:MAG: flagellar protein FlgN [Candidatus Zixiibacteriota bacterium]|nr:MAG: flagellar protein FlgN [candidate division Zixibacteria bacterium]
MSHFIQELIDLIRQEEEVLNRFLALLRRQKEYLLANQIDLFRATVGQQEELMEDIRRLEEQRIAKVRDMAASTGLKEDEITLTHLIEVTLGDVSTELKDLKKNLSQLVERIRRTSRVNELLIKRSLNFIQQSIGWMIDASDITQVYDPTGRTTRQAETSVMVNKTL